MPEPKPGYGQTKAKDLLEQIQICLSMNCLDTQLEAALMVLTAYADFNEKVGVVLPTIREKTECLLTEFKTRKSLSDDQAGGGTRQLSKVELVKFQSMDFKSFAFSRHSIRNFIEQPISPDLIREAVAIAQKSPSVCNRQSSRVHVFENDATGKKLLQVQDGNKGFGHTANKIFVITSDLSTFLAIGERNQCWIDGSLFAMTFIYALHSMGIGTCCLNWSKKKEDDQALRQIAKLAEQENIIMLIAAGYPPDNFFVPWSYRVPVNEILHFH